MTETLGRTAFDETLRGLAPKVATARKTRRGDIAFRPTGGKPVVLAAERGKAEVVPAEGRTGKPIYLSDLATELGLLAKPL